MKQNVRAVLVGLALVGLVAGVYLQAVGFGFVFDDGVYITENTPIHQGLTRAGVWWAFSGLRVAFWHPLTWLSHMLDVTLYGLNPAGHHLSAIILHAANSVLCFLVLRAGTGATWPAAFAAALFAIHPLRVESVAYVSERKDVLSVLFWFLTMAAWLRYLRRPSRGWYLATLGVFALGLMAKPMLVTLPFVLLLLDFWPFDRLRTGPFQLSLRRGGAPRRMERVSSTARGDGWEGVALSHLHPPPPPSPPGRGKPFSPELTAVSSQRPQWLVGRLLLEKAPLLVLSIAASVVAFVAEKDYGALSPVVPFPLGVRLLNVICFYGGYLEKTIWPTRLAAFYPHPGPDFSLVALLASTAVLMATSVIAARTRQRLPFVAVGWFWFLGTLVPVIGLVQLGDMGLADRFTYLPAVGLSITIAWGTAAWAGRGSGRPAIVKFVSPALILASALLSFHQVGFWRDGISLFSHAVAVTGVNPLARYNLSVALIQAGRREEAARELRRIIEEYPGYVPAYHDLGALLFEAGLPQPAAEILSVGVDRFPRSHRLHFRLGLVLMGLGSTAEAISHFEEALRLRPGYSDAHIELGVIQGNLGRLDEAEGHFREALALDPASEPARWNLRHLQEVRDEPARGRR